MLNAMQFMLLKRVEPPAPEPSKTGNLNSTWLFATPVGIQVWVAFPHHGYKLFIVNSSILQQIWELIYLKWIIKKEYANIYSFTLG